MRIPAPRTKSFSHKVRTGCITCKRRRVKCDERKPSCLRCSKANLICDGYDIPRPKIFELKPSQGNHLLKVSAFEDDNEHQNNSQIRPLIPTLGTIFQNTEDMCAFETYVTVTGPMVASYSPQVESLLVNFIPKIAMYFPAVKHLIISIGAAHKWWLQNQMFDENVPQWALSHYNKSIHDVVRNKPPNFVIFVTALLSFCLEILRYNYTAAAVHMQGMRSAFQDIEYGGSPEVDRATQELISTDIRLARELVEGTFKVIESNKLGMANDSFADYVTIQEAKDSLVQRLNLFARSPRDENDIHEMRTFLTHWINRFRKWDQTLPQSVLRDALRLLFLLALSLLPSDQTGGFSHSHNSMVVEYVLKKVSELRHAKGISDETVTALNETLKLVLVYIIRCYHEEDYQERAASMLTVFSIERP